MANVTKFELEFLDTLQIHMKERRITNAMIAKKLGLAHSTVCEYFNRDRTLRMTTAEKLANSLGYDIQIKLVRQKR